MWAETMCANSRSHAQRGGMLFPRHFPCPFISPLSGMWPRWQANQDHRNKSSRGWSNRIEGCGFLEDLLVQSSHTSSSRYLWIEREISLCHCYFESGPTLHLNLYLNLMLSKLFVAQHSYNMAKCVHQTGIKRWRLCWGTINIPEIHTYSLLPPSPGDAGSSISRTSMT